VEVSILSASTIDSCFTLSISIFELFSIIICIIFSMLHNLSSFLVQCIHCVFSLGLTFCRLFLNIPNLRIIIVYIYVCYNYIVLYSYGKMSGTITSDAVVTSTISSSSNLQIGSFTWPSAAPSSGQVLKTDDSGNLSFRSVNTRIAIGALVTTDTIDVLTDIVAITGTLATSLTLPDPSTKSVGDIIHIVKEVSGASIITISPFSTELISGNASSTLSTSYGSMKVYTNGIDWFELS